MVSNGGDDGMSKQTIPTESRVHHRFAVSFHFSLSLSLSPAALAVPGFIALPTLAFSGFLSNEESRAHPPHINIGRSSPLLPSLPLPSA